MQSSAGIAVDFIIASTDDDGLQRQPPIGPLSLGPQPIGPPTGSQCSDLILSSGKQIFTLHIAFVVTVFMRQ